MSSEWVSLTIGDLVRHGEATVQTGPFGSQLHSYDYVASGTPVIPTEAIGRGQILDIEVPRVNVAKASELARHQLRVGDILFARRGAQATGLSAIVDERFEGALCGTGALLLRLQSPRIDPQYLAMFLSSETAYSWLRTHAVGAVMPNLNTAIIQALPVSLPEIREQQRIAGFIGVLDDRVTLLRETNATLEAFAQALFKSWFVDFDPVRAKMEGRMPEGMDEATAALFPDGFEETELGAVPRGWALKPFGELLAHSIGGDWGSKQSEEKNTVRVAIIRGTDIPDLKVGRDNRVPIRYTSEKKLSTRQLQDGDIVIEVSGGSKDQPTGRSLYITDELLKRFDCPVEPASFCRLFRPIDKSTGVLLAQHLQFIYDQGKTWEYQNQSTGIANFQTTHFLEKELVAIPSESALNIFSETVRALVDRTIASQIDELIQIRDTLLPRLISGQLRLDKELDASHA